MKTICENCPRHCEKNNKNNLGFCEASDSIEISKTMIHYWEEPIISGTNETRRKGSGAIFFTHCNLKCVFCQNYEISHGKSGKKISLQKLIQIFKDFEKQKVTNINLVTPTHYSNQILEALKIYKPNVPVVYNCGGYEDEKVIEKLKGYVDIFLFDFKYFSNELAFKYSYANNYFEKCLSALKKAREICPKDIIKNNLMKKGIIVRILILPTHTDDSIKILQTIKNHFGTKIYISLMSQYTPMGDAKNFPEINRKLKVLEYNRVLRKLEELGFENGFIQSLESANESFIPNFCEDNLS